MDDRLTRYRVLLAPAIARADGVIKDPDDLKIAERLLMAAQAPGGRGMTRGEIFDAAGLDDAGRAASRFDLLVKVGAFRRRRGDKKHQQRYAPNPDAMVAGELLARLGERGAVEHLHAMLLETADDVALAFVDDPDGDPPPPGRVAERMQRLTATLHSYARKLEDAVASQTMEEMVEARVGTAPERMTRQASRLSEYISREGSPYAGLFDQATRLVRGAQRFIDASQELADRLAEVTATADGTDLLAMLSPDQVLRAAIHRPRGQLADVAADVPLHSPPPLLHTADLEAAADDIGAEPPPRAVPEPPPIDDGDGQTAADIVEQAAERRRQARERRRDWAAVQLGSGRTTDLTNEASSWPHAAEVLHRLLALSADPDSGFAGDIGDPPLVDPDGPLAIHHPLRLRRTGTRDPHGSAAPDEEAAADV